MDHFLEGLHAEGVGKWVGSFDFIIRGVSLPECVLIIPPTNDREESGVQATCILRSIGVGSSSGTV